MARPTARVWRALTALTIAAAAGIVRLAAHPAGTTSVIVTFDQKGRVEVAVDAEAGPLAQKLAVLQTALEQSVHLTIDEVPVTLAHAGTEHSAASGVDRVVVRLAGAVPAGGRHFSVRSSLVLGSYPLVIRRAGVSGESIEWLQGSQPSRPAPVSMAGPTRPAMAFLRDFTLGFTHILPKGLDHILFVLGLFLLRTRLRSVLAQVSAFTVAHSITLGLTLYGVVSLPSSVIEPLIALSIVYIACENLYTSRLTAWRLAVVFAFGLLHGMGFAEALAHVNLARADFLTTLVSFNVGVEAGQLAVIAAAALAVSALRVPAADYRRLVGRPCSLGIALVGVFWLIERTS